MTRSPLGSVRRYALGWLCSYCSATRGEIYNINFRYFTDLQDFRLLTQHLKSPTPLPKRINPRINAASAPFGLAMTLGMAAIMIKM